jgi:hypothetical protein
LIASRFYFQEADTGLAALIPGTSGAMDVARFRLTAGLADPRKKLNRLAEITLAKASGAPVSYEGL